MNRERLQSLAAFAVPGAALVYLAFRGGGTAAGVAALVAVALGALVLARVQAAPVDAEFVGRMANGAVLAVPGALVLYFAFNAGGFFPSAPALAAIVLLLIMVLKVTLADDPLAGFGWPVAVAVVAMCLYCLWILLSADWSNAPGRAFVDFDKALMYTLALVVPATLPRTAARLSWMVRGVALAILVVGTVALLTRVLPDTFPSPPSVSNQRLAYPLTYWNALGVLVSAGIVLCLHLASTMRELPAVRVIASAALPVLATTLFFTFSRGAIAAGIVGVVLYVVIGRPRGLVTAGLAVVPTGIIAVVAAYHANLLATDNPTSKAAVAQGHDVALAVVLCVLGAAVIRSLLLLADRPLRRLELRPELRAPVLRGAWAAFAAVVVVLAVAVNAPGWLSDQYDNFVHTTALKSGGDLRQRLLDPANNGRIEHWRVASLGFQANPLRGDGAGTYGVRWVRDRKPSYSALVVRDAHSLYLEVLDELGIVGLILLATAILAILAAFVPIRRGRNRSLYAALFAAGAVWAIHTGVDWDWEMPASSVWLFGLGGGALAVHANRVVPRQLPQGARLLVGVALLAAAVTPALVLVSQRQLNAGVVAWNNGLWGAAARHSIDSINTLDIRPEPYETIGMAQARGGEPLLGPPALAKAVAADPQDWEFRYSQALVLGAAGRDPLPAALAAKRLNPHDQVLGTFVSTLRRAGPSARVAIAKRELRDANLSVVR